jgi:hypothetical protein
LLAFNINPINVQIFLRTARHSTLTLASFAWIPTLSSASSHRLLSVNRDGTVETVHLKESPITAWCPRGNMAWACGNRLCISNIDKPPDKVVKRDISTTLSRDQQDHLGSNHGEDTYEVSGSVIAVGRNGEGKNGMHFSQHNGDGATRLQYYHKQQQHGNAWDFDQASGTRTPKPGDPGNREVNSLQNGLKTTDFGTGRSDDDVVPGAGIGSGMKLARAVLENNVTVVMRRRALRGYCMNASIHVCSCSHSLHLACFVRVTA